MATVKTKEMEVEHTLQRLQAEIATTTIAMQKRAEIEKAIANYRKQFEEAKAKKANGVFAKLESELMKLDKTLAQEAIRQAETEISKNERASVAFQALENIRKDLESGKITPNHARHEVKEIVRKR